VRGKKARGSRVVARSEQPKIIDQWLESTELSDCGTLAETHESTSSGCPGSPGSDVTFRTARWLVPTTFSRGEDDHHGAVFSLKGVEVYFARSEFWTERKRSVDALRVVNGHVFGNGQNAGLAVKLDSIGGKRCELNFARLNPKASDHVANRTTLLQLAHQ